MKTRLFLIVTLLLTGAAAWYFFLQKSTTTGRVEEMIPVTSVGVLSINNPQALFSDLPQYDWWDEVAALPLFANGVEVLSAIDSLGIKSNLTQLPAYVSFHITANDQLEALYLFNASSFDWEVASIKTILDRLYTSEQVVISERNYLGRTLFEVSVGGQNISFFIQQGYLAISTNALLVEDVVRAVEQGASLLARRTYQVSNPRADISLLLDCGKLDDLVGVFSNAESGVASSNELFVRLDIEALPEGLSLNGSSLFSNDGLLAEEASLRLKNFIPTTASVVKWFGLDQNTQKNEKGIDALNLEDYLSLHSGDLCLVDLDLNNDGIDRVLLASVSNGVKGKEQLTVLATNLMVGNDTLFKESFMDTEIIFVNKSELPKALYGDVAAGFSQVYFSSYNDVLIFGSSIDAIKSVLAEYDAENTWGRSIERRKYVDDLVQETNFTLIYNFEYLLESIRDDIKPGWSDFFEARKGFTDALDLFSVQLSNTGNGMLVNAAVSFNQSTDRVYNVAPVSEVSGDRSVALTTKINVFADTALLTRSFVTRNHNSNGREMIFQDASNQLYLVNDQGVVLWKQEVGESITGDISQIDYYNNKKLQYFFFTQTAMHLVDRNGDNVEGFPKPLDTALPLNGHRVVDYDNTKRYRYAGADRRGNVYLYNKEGIPLDGWSPKAMGSQLLGLPEHVRIRGRDCFLMIETKGTIHLTNRRGEYYPGFPYEGNKRLAGDAVIVKGADFSKSSIATIADNGELIGLDFNGKVVSRKQLLRPQSNSRFQLIKDRLNNGYALGRRDADKIVFFDKSGAEMFDLPVKANDELEFGFYNFRNDSEVIVIWNRTSGKVDVFDKEGRSVVGEPLDANAPIGIIYYQSRAEYELFVNFANQMAVYTVRK